MPSLVLLGARGEKGTAVLRAWERNARGLGLRCLARATSNADVGLRSARDGAGTEAGPAGHWEGDLARLPEGLLPEDEHVVLHFAVKQVDPDGTGFEANVESTRRLLEQLDPSRCRGILYASSASVYGRGPNVRVPEDAPLSPRTPLARSRFESERLLFAWGREHGVSVLALRTRFVLSPASATLGRALLGLARSAVIPGSGSQKLSAIDGDRFGEAVLELARRIFDRRPTREALNLALTGSPSLSSVLDAIEPRHRLGVPLGRGIVSALDRVSLPGGLRRFLDFVELVGVEQTLDCARAVSEHGLGFLERPPEEAIAAAREAVPGGAA